MMMGYGDYGDYSGMGWGAGGWLVMGLMMLLFFAVLLALVVWGVVAAGGFSLRGSQRAPVGGDTPLDILRRRYASGEIGPEEFEHAQQVVRGDHQFERIHESRERGGQ